MCAKSNVDANWPTYRHPHYFSYPQPLPCTYPPVPPPTNSNTHNPFPPSHHPQTLPSTSPPTTHPSTSPPTTPSLHLSTHNPFPSPLQPQLIISSPALDYHPLPFIAVEGVTGCPTTTTTTFPLLLVAVLTSPALSAAPEMYHKRCQDQLSSLISSLPELPRRSPRSIWIPSLPRTVNSSTIGRTYPECTEFLFLQIYIEAGVTQDHIFGCTYDEVDAVLIDSYDALNICSVEQQCVQVLPSLSDIIQPHSDSQGLQFYLEQGVVIVLKYLIAFQQFIMDQMLYESDSQFIEGGNSVYQNLELLYIYLNQAVEACGASPDNTVYRDMVDKMHINKTDIDRDLRGFMVFRQTLKGMKYIQDTLGGVTGTLLVEDLKGEWEWE
ncbi:hypothetical protein Pmani_032665 [Petrolisthes manimaculis]|uniref:Uncharacterized protein n=1 Tax=Petrolisthes manimaculis TaxID=1843537 RepID=A0AAE1NRD2_9EUCA|nr:hypothetical protein Pmani_032665 [Petrolisthes manimaculis]